MLNTKHNSPLQLLLCLGAALAMSGCLFVEETPPGENNGDPWDIEITKKEAAERMQNDPDSTPDYCESEGWYGDGVCDEFCYEPDPDCEVGCQANSDCTADAYCARPDDACAGEGTCEPRPDACPTVYAPVCGCDDVTYGNSCEAHAAGVNVARDGECAVAECTPEECGPAPGAPSQLCPDGTVAGPVCDRLDDGSCGWIFTTCPDAVECEPGDGACDADMFCMYDEAQLCGADGAPGICHIRPGACPEYFMPVCGCDGVTYGNDCEAHAAGTSVAHQGDCEQPEQRCGGIGGQACPRGEYCHYEPDQMCGADDGQGVCAPLPQGCDAVYDPVCGCDGRTYGNACMAHAAGTSVASLGECQTGNDSCGGFAGMTCAPDEYCDFTRDAMCGFADATGTCEPRPNACPDIWMPVCGCDGQTYGNECEAHAAGTSALRDGPCDPTGMSCGGLTPNGSPTCPDGFFCDYELAAMCGFADAPGTCQKIPSACTEQYDPVCGCDGETYDNECKAHAAGTSVQSRGECE